MKVVVNRQHGGYQLSKKAYDYLGIPWDEYGFEFSDDRTNPRLVEVVETLGKDASGGFANLEVVEVPDDVNWEIHNYDGWETIHEKHRVW